MADYVRYPILGIMSGRGFVDCVCRFLWESSYLCELRPNVKFETLAERRETSLGWTGPSSGQAEAS